MQTSRMKHLRVEEAQNKRSCDRPRALFSRILQGDRPRILR